MAETPEGADTAEASPEGTDVPAEGTDVPQESTEDVNAEAAVPERAGIGEARTWVGFKLDELGGANAGRVEGVFVDEQTGEPEWLLARMGRFGAYSFVPARDAVGVAGHVWVPYTRELIRGAPKADPKSALTRPRELELLAYYGIDGDAGRAAELSSREPEGVTARPAH